MTFTVHHDHRTAARNVKTFDPDQQIAGAVCVRDLATYQMWEIVTGDRVDELLDADPELAIQALSPDRILDQARRRQDRCPLNTTRVGEIEELCERRKVGDRQTWRGGTRSEYEDVRFDGFIVYLKQPLCLGRTLDEIREASLSIGPVVVPYPVFEQVYASAIGFDLENREHDWRFKRPTKGTIKKWWAEQGFTTQNRSDVEVVLNYAPNNLSAKQRKQQREADRAKYQELMSGELPGLLRTRLAQHLFPYAWSKHSPVDERAQRFIANRMPSRPPAEDDHDSPDRSPSATEIRGAFELYQRMHGARRRDYRKSPARETSRYGSYGNYTTDHAVGDWKAVVEETLPYLAAMSARVPTKESRAQNWREWRVNFGYTALKAWQRMREHDDRDEYWLTRFLLAEARALRLTIPPLPDNPDETRKT